MKLRIPPLFRQIKDKSRFLVIEVGFEKVTACGFYKGEEDLKVLGVGRETLIGNLEEALSTSLEALSVTVPKFPKEVIFGTVKSSISETTVVKYQRNPKDKISNEEVKNILEKSTRKIEGFVPYFSSLTYARVDGKRIFDIEGTVGENLEVSCFNSYINEEESLSYHKLLEKFGLNLKKALPSSFAVARYLLKEGNSDLLLLRLAKSFSEVSLIHDNHVIGIKWLPVGLDEENFWEIFSVTLETFAHDQSWPNTVGVYGELLYDEVKEKLQNLAWEEVLKEKPTFKEFVAPNEILKFDLGVYSLAKEA